MSNKVLAKFRITSVSSGRFVPYDRNPETGQYEHGAPVESCQVKLGAVQGEPFGRYTPQGSADLTIISSAAAHIFREAWHQYVTSADPQAREPEFYVTFEPAPPTEG